MCGIAGIVNLSADPVADIEKKLDVMGDLIKHRGPDASGSWVSPDKSVGLVHQRLSILDLSSRGTQPMVGESGDVVSYNGEIYNYLELRNQLKDNWNFTSKTDTECILAAYSRFDTSCLAHFRGMFSFALWDEKNRRLFCARDRFGIKPFYYTVVDGVLYFASETKSLLPFLPELDIDDEALAEYLTFQFAIGEKTLFKNIYSLMPGHALSVSQGKLDVWRYWDVHYEVDFGIQPDYCEQRIQELFDDSVRLHLRSDVPLGSYLSGGIDSSLIAMLAARQDAKNNLSFHGKFTDYPGYDESRFAREVAGQSGNVLHEITITAEDFDRHIRDVIYHLDFPVAGPGSFPQFMVSRFAAQHVKVILGGQGGDEIFGGYARYVLAYFEQCIKAALDGNYKNGNYVVTIESIIPNLGLLREYKPMIRNFWKEGLFGELDERYFRLVDRSSDMTNEVDWKLLDKKTVYEKFKSIFNNPANVGKEAYFDKMSHFDFKCLLPALLHVEDRMSMAHGLESRVPMLDHALVEFAATVPADIKFEGGRMKHLIKNAYSSVLPDALLNRRDKMGFPVPLKEWFENELSDLVNDTFRSTRAGYRPFMRRDAVLKSISGASSFSRKIWGLLSLELWQQEFIDRAAHYRSLVDFK